MSYNFKNIKVISSANDLINIVLSKTQRKTPTVIHPGYAISRIRSFYMRKIKFCQQSISEKLVDALQHFPKIQDIHPFYADLFNVLYDKDHYKLALGHLKATKNMVQNMSKDYLKLVKYGDSLYRCKALKRAALGRMCTMIRKIGSSLSYLQQVRKHLGRLPSINPYERTLMLTGFPNVGKSSLINCISRANVQVQPFPFTTKALYIGHTQYQTTRFQVIDSPGVLDHQLEDMNTIQMQSVTALAHLKSCVLYLIDPSQQCGYDISQQIKLYGTLKPLFKNKPIIVVFTKNDIKKIQDLPITKQNIINQWLKQNNLTFIAVSTKTGDGIKQCKQMACIQVLKMKLSIPDSKLLKNQQNISNLYIAIPKKRDDIDRPPVIVDISKKINKKTIKQIQQQNGGAGVFSIPLQQHYILPQQWKYDIVPQIFNGKNIADFVDVDIWQKLGEIQKEQDLLLDMQQLKIQQDNTNVISNQLKNAYEQIQRKKNAFREEHELKRYRTAYSKKKYFNDFKQKLDQKGIDASFMQQRMRNRSKSKSLLEIKGKKIINDMEDQDCENQNGIRERIRQASRSRSKGYIRKKTKEEQKGEKQINKLSKKWRTMDKKGESDRFIGTSRPKHLYSGKTSSGRRDRR